MAKQETFSEFTDEFQRMLCILYVKIFRSRHPRRLQAFSEYYSTENPEGGDHFEGCEIFYKNPEHPLKLICESKPGNVSCFAIC